VAIREETAGYGAAGGRLMFLRRSKLRDGVHPE
jgi:hypothetical protein